MHVIPGDLTIVQVRGEEGVDGAVCSQCPKKKR